MKTTFISFSILLFFLHSSPTAAADATQIMAQSKEASYYQGKDGHAQIDMQIIDKQGRTRLRRLTMLRKNMDQNYGAQKYYVYFNQPADVKRMVFMAWKKETGDDDRWFYLPALDLVKRIAASDKRTSFVGSHFFYEDVSGRNIDEDEHVLLTETDTDYQIKSIPKYPDTVEFAYYLSTIDKKTALPLKAEYFKTNNQRYRSYTVSQIEVIQGHATVTKATMADHITGGKTEVQFSNIRYNLNLPNKIFSERSLRRAPKKHLK